MKPQSMMLLRVTAHRAAGDHGFRTVWVRLPDPRSGKDFGGIDGVPATAAQGQDRAMPCQSLCASDYAT